MKCQFCENGTLEITFTDSGVKVVHVPGGEAGTECLQKLHEVIHKAPWKETEL